MCNSCNSWNGDNSCWWIIILFAVILFWCYCGGSNCGNWGGGCSNGCCNNNWGSNDDCGCCR
ncbi:MAG: hypothetical protein KH050_00025 [Clostridiaceae bacterium]|nr:hypothetical protein [Clostridiaceae bacterium]